MIPETPAKNCISCFETSRGAVEREYPDEESAAAAAFGGVDAAGALDSEKVEINTVMTDKKQGIQSVALRHRRIRIPLAVDRFIA